MLVKGQMFFHDLPADLAGMGQDQVDAEAAVTFPICFPYPSVESLDLSFGSMVKNYYIMNVIPTPQTWKG